MDSQVNHIALVALIGIGATAVMDAWLLLLQRLGVPTTDIGLIGRWVGHLARGRVAHASIAKAAPIAGERAIGWLTHYAVGIAFAALLVAVQGTTWLREPTLWPALAIGVATVAMPWFVMQPAMGAGFASAKTPTPLKNRLRSLANHAVFGLGLYLAARLIEVFSR
jgi:hypothetical protein